MITVKSSKSRHRRNPFIPHTARLHYYLGVHEVCAARKRRPHQEGFSVSNERSRTMINPKVMSTAAAMVLVLSAVAPTAGFADYKNYNGVPVRGNGGYHPPPPAGYTRPGPAVAAAPAVSGYRAPAPMAQPGVGGGGAVYRGG
jgi:hypothetical protein